METQNPFFGIILANFILEDGKTAILEKEKKLEQDYSASLANMSTRVNFWEGRKMGMVSLNFKMETSMKGNGLMELKVEEESILRPVQALIIVVSGKMGKEMAMEF